MATLQLEVNSVLHNVKYKNEKMKMSQKADMLEKVKTILKFASKTHLWTHQAISDYNLLLTRVK